jgi:hypothetical protein
MQRMQNTVHTVLVSPALTQPRLRLVVDQIGIQSRPVLHTTLIIRKNTTAPGRSTKPKHGRLVRRDGIPAQIMSGLILPISSRRTEMQDGPRRMRRPSSLHTGAKGCSTHEPTMTHGEVGTILVCRTARQLPGVEMTLATLGGLPVLVRRNPSGREPPTRRLRRTGYGSLRPHGSLTKLVVTVDTAHAFKTVATTPITSTMPTRRSPTRRRRTGSTSPIVPETLGMMSITSTSKSFFVPAVMSVS